MVIKQYTDISDTSEHFHLFKIRTNKFIQICWAKLGILYKNIDEIINFFVSMVINIWDRIYIFKWNNTVFVLNYNLLFTTHVFVFTSSNIEITEIIICYTYQQINQFLIEETTR